MILHLARRIWTTDLRITAVITATVLRSTSWAIASGPPIEWRLHIAIVINLLWFVLVISQWAHELQTENRIHVDNNYSYGLSSVNVKFEVI